MITETESIGVIVADDDPMVRSVLRAKLEAMNVSVLLTSGGLETVELASRLDASLILLDLNMPHLNGLFACERIRQLPGHAHTPIVILTSTPGKKGEAAAARAGATAYFTKPFRPALLLHAVAQHLPISDAARALIRRNAEEVKAIVYPGARAAGRWT